MSPERRVAYTWSPKCLGVLGPAFATLETVALPSDSRQSPQMSQRQILFLTCPRSLILQGSERGGGEEVLGDPATKSRGEGLFDERSGANMA